jgi:cellulose biosynthesis protein BcsQ
VKGKPSIISVQNQKGGVGKTQTSVTLATGLAIEFPAEYQIVVIDMDGQSTLTSYFPSNEKRTTIGDLVLLDPKSDDYQEKVRAAVSDTNYRNLKIIPAAQKDRDIESVFHEGVHAEMISDPYKRLNSVIDAIKYDCDIIIIDTPPSLGYASINSYYAANAVIFPIGATQPDTDATCQYFTYIPDTYRTLMRLGHSGYDFSKILITNFDKSQSSMEVVDEVQFYFNGSYLNTEFVKSEAVRRCSLHKSTVFDYSKSGYKGTKATYESAYKNSKDIVFEVANLIFEQWDLNRD